MRLNTPVILCSTPGSGPIPAVLMPGRCRCFLLLIAVLVAPSAGAHAVFDAPRQFGKPGITQELDLGPQAESFIRFAQVAHGHAVKDAESLRLAVDAFLDSPDETHLERARSAWREARPAYQRIEMLRFFNGPLDHPSAPGVPAGPESRINAWPVNEAAIDYVKGSPRSGLVFRSSTPLTRQEILDADQVADEADVTTGWHAIEFLLWGQDFRSDGPGERSADDYLPGSPSRDRRREYLRLLVDMLIEDLSQQAQAWDGFVPQSYAQWLSTQPAVEILGRGIHGAASLAAIEIYGQRLTAPLDSGSQEDEHSCFSDNTLADLRNNLLGIRYFAEASYADEKLGSGLIELLQWKDPALAKRLSQALSRAEADLAAVPEPFDQVLGSPEGSEGRSQAETAAESVRQVAVALKAAAESLGIDIVVPGV